jgi:hypothetical protein
MRNSDCVSDSFQGWDECKKEHSGVTTVTPDCHGVLSTTCVASIKKARASFAYTEADVRYLARFVQGLNATSLDGVHVDGVTKDGSRMRQRRRSMAMMVFA